MDQCDRIAPLAWCVDVGQERKEFFATPSFVEGSATARPAVSLMRRCFPRAVIGKCNEQLARVGELDVKLRTSIGDSNDWF